MSNDYPPSGVLFTNNRKEKPSQPDYTGSLEISDEVLSDLVSQMERGISKPKLDLAGWKRVSKKNGSTFLSLVGNVQYEKKDQGSPAPQARTSLNDEVPF
jgi:hypothetical protein